MNDRFHVVSPGGQTLGRVDVILDLIDKVLAECEPERRTMVDAPAPSAYSLRSRQRTSAGRFRVSHVSRIMQKLAVRDRAQLVIVAFRTGLATA